MRTDSGVTALQQHTWDSSQSSHKIRRKSFKTIQSSSKELSCQFSHLRKLVIVIREPNWGSCSYQNSRVAANKVYNEVIAHKEHVHMNGKTYTWSFINRVHTPLIAATRWTSLTEFVQDLASQGVCTVEETDKGLFVSLIQRGDLETAVKRRRSDDLSSDKRQQKVFISFIVGLAELENLRSDRRAANEESYMWAKSVVFSNGFKRGRIHIYCKSWHEKGTVSLNIRSLIVTRAVTSEEAHCIAELTNDEMCTGK